MPRTTADFAARVLDACRSSDPRRMTLAKSLHETAEEIVARAMGHPDFADLPLGGTNHCDGAAVFLDLDEFTSRTFWDSPESMVRLARAVLTQIVEVVVDLGGFVLGLRGDGVFACFGGPGSDPSVDVATALGAAAFALDATENALNNLLIMDGLEPVRLRAARTTGGWTSSVPVVTAPTRSTSLASRRTSPRSARRSPTAGSLSPARASASTSSTRPCCGPTLTAPSATPATA